MAEIIAAIGTAGALCNVVDALGKTIAAAYSLHEQWRNADLAFLSLVSQLEALQSALRQIQDIHEANSQALQHATINIGTSVSCCRILVERIAVALDGLEQEGIRMNGSNRVKFPVRSIGIGDVQKLLEHQTSALTLLFSAISCRSAMEQDAVQRGTSSVQIVQQFRQDSISILSFDDSSSIATGIRDNMSKLSWMFTFDGELADSRVYKRSLWSSMKLTLREQRARKVSSPAANSGLPSEIAVTNEIFVTTDQYPQEEYAAHNNTGHIVASDRVATTWTDVDLFYCQMPSRKLDGRLNLGTKLPLNTDMKLLLLGVGRSGKTTIFEQLQRLYTDEAMRDETLQPYEIQDAFVLAAEKMSRAAAAGLTRYELSWLHSDLDDLFDLLAIELDGSESDGFSLDDVGRHVSSIWDGLGQIGVAADDLKHIGIDHCTAYWLRHARRITSPLYVPTQEDKLRYYSRTVGIYEKKLAMEQLYCELYDVPGSRAGRKKWIHVFDQVNQPAVIFVVNLASYDESLYEDETSNGLAESLMLFTSIVNSDWFTRSKFVLLFTNLELFKAKVVDTPIRQYFGEELPWAKGTQDQDWMQSARYICWRFLQLSDRVRPIYPCILEALRINDVHATFLDIQEKLTNCVNIEPRVKLHWADESETINRLQGGDANEHQEVGVAL